jgi:gluconokinase
VLEGITLSLYQIAKGLEDGGLELKQIHISGGFVHSDVWVQLLADVFGKKVLLVNNEDASAIGAAFIAMKSLGVKGAYEVFDESSCENFVPDPEKHRYYKEFVFPLFEHLYKALILEMHILSEQKK